MLQQITKQHFVIQNLRYNVRCTMYNVLNKFIFEGRKVQRISIKLRKLRPGQKRCYFQDSTNQSSEEKSENPRGCTIWLVVPG